MKKDILVTGGMGYIGSHTVVELCQNYNPIIIDNLCNSSIETLDCLEQICGFKPTFYEGDVRNAELLNTIFNQHNIYAVIHFAGLKAVGESVLQPLMYYENNLISTLSLVRAMQQHNCKRLVFSSSATVYGNPERLPLTEDCALRTSNPYGATKLMIEDMLRDIYSADNNWHIALLRYFNPVGAHASSLIGEVPRGIPNNLVPYIARVGTGELKELSVFGNDYPTPDGTGKRDYIHVVDLAVGHIMALDKIDTLGCEAINLGTGESYSVLDIVKAYAAALGKPIPYKFMPRRPGDIAECYADTTKAERLLGFKTTHSLDDMCKSSIAFQSKK